MPVFLFFALLVVAVALYVLGALGTSYVLKAGGYKNPWMAWIPYVRDYALADFVLDGDSEVTLFKDFSIPSIVFKFYWAIPLLLFLLSSKLAALSLIINLLTLAINIICQGLIYQIIYSLYDDKAEDDVKVLGYLSGAFGIIAVVKFLAYRGSKVVPDIQ